MNVLPINQDNLYCNAEINRVFGHSNKKTNNGYTKKQQALMITASTLGVLSSLALLAKHDGYSLKPSKMFKDIKHSYLATTDFEAKEVIAMGAGSCIGGLAGGYIVDKNPENRKAKRRETLMQIGNVSFPILTVHLLVKKVFKNSSEGIRTLAGLGGVVIGVALSNLIMNQINHLIFKEKDGENRKMKFTDFSAHLDDLVVAATYISKADIVHAIGRLVPAALVIPGLEVANKTAENTQ